MFWFIIPGLWKSKPVEGKLVSLRNKSDAINLKLKIDHGKLSIIKEEETKVTEEEWTLPKENTIGLIEHSSGMVLNIDTTNDTEVLLQPRKYFEDQTSDDSDDQTWFRCPSNKDGYFILKHIKTGRCLTIDKDRNLTIGQFFIRF